MLLKKFQTCMPLVRRQQTEKAFHFFFFQKERGFFFSQKTHMSLRKKLIFAKQLPVNISPLKGSQNDFLNRLNAAYFWLL